MDFVRLVDLPRNRVSFSSFESETHLNSSIRPNYSVDKINGFTRNKPAVVWAKLSNVTLLIEPGFDGVVYTEDDQILWESCRYLRPGASHSDMWLDGGLRALRASDKVLDNHESAMICFDPGWINYYHWLLQCLPGTFHAQCYYPQKTIVFPQYGSYSGRKISPAFTESVYEDSLAKVLPSQASMSLLSPGLYRLPELYYLVPFFAREHNTLFDCTFSREYILKLLADRKPSEAMQRIFVSRSKAGNSKRLENAEHLRLSKLAKDIGYKEVLLENMSFDQQIDTFLNASHVLSAHGAGLSNIIFSRNLSLTEYNNPFGDESILRQHFQFLARQLGHKSSVIDRTILDSPDNLLREILTK